MDCHGQGDQIQPANPDMGGAFHDWVLGVEFEMYVTQRIVRPDACENWFSSLKNEYAEYASITNPAPVPAPTEIHSLMRMFVDGLIGIEPDSYGRSAEYMSRLLVTMHERSLLVTEEGYVGLGARCCRPSDEIWRIRGGRVPLVLRPNGEGKYRYMGECYLHGGMKDGSLLGWTGDLMERIRLI